jgi:hypothetical protein
MSRVPPTYSHKPPARENHDPKRPSRRERRARIHHHGVFTRNSVWRNWLDLPLLEEGIRLRVERLAKRRGKSKTWASKRANRDIRLYNLYRSGQAARMKEILEQMQHGILHGEHDHEEQTNGEGTSPEENTNE